MRHRRSFRFGVLVERGHTRHGLIETARAAEAAGYAALLLRDHFVEEPFGHQLAPLVALAAVAGATERLRVGTMVLDNDYRHPVMLAKEAASLDVLSGGRFELGLGAGWLRDEYERAGMPYDPAGVRIDRLEESIRVLKGLFGDGAFSFTGGHYHVTELDGFPNSVQRPHPPFLIGGGGKRMLRLAGREADIVGVLNSSVASGTMANDPRELSPERVTEKVGWIREGAGERFDDIELSMVISPMVTDDARAGAERFAAERGWNGLASKEVLGMPSVFVGSEAGTAAAMEERREQYGFSYYVVSDGTMATFAPIVARLAGQ